MASSPTRQASPRRASHVWLFGALLVVAVGGVFGLWQWSENLWFEARLAGLRDAVAGADAEEAIRVAEELLRTDPDCAEAALLGARAAAMRNDYTRAFAWLERATASMNPHWVAAETEKGLIRLRQLKVGAAERHFKRALEKDPNYVPALRPLSYLLAVEGRSFETTPYCYRLVRQRAATIEDLVILGTQQPAITVEDILHRFIERDPDNPMPLIGMGRLVAHRKNGRRLAEDYFRRVLSDRPDMLQAHFLLGDLYLRAPHRQRDALLQRWNRDLPSTADRHAGIWAIRGLWAEQRRDWSGAARCFLESLKLDPNLGVSAYQLSVCLAALGYRDDVNVFKGRSAALAELSSTSVEIHEDGPSPTLVSRAAVLCEQLGRFWEAFAWAQVLIRSPPPSLEGEELEVYHKTLGECRAIAERLEVKLAADLPQVHPDFEPVRDFPMDRFPHPDFNTPRPDHENHPPADLAREPAFRDVTREVGIDFTYFNSDDPSTEGRRMFEFTGGGVAVIDYDQDGWPDLYFTQGCRWPVAPDATRYRDRLYRNIGGTRFVDVTAEAGLGDTRFTQGAAAGDYNNDGWPDLLVGNVGANRLYLNNGDGTFTETTAAAGIMGDVWTTSCAIADLNGDAVPDLYCVNYLQKGRSLTLICGRNGKLRACSPTEFDAEQDHFFLGRGDGTFADRTRQAGFIARDGKGLGCLVADFDRSGSLDLFVANDTTSNFLFVNTAPRGSRPAFVDRAAVAGASVDRNGLAQACMGIAFDDFDGDGLFDLFVTNFHNESNALYRQQRDQGSGFFFLDESDLWGVLESSIELLGFGTQVLDAELDGLPDLVIANGHVDDFRYMGTPFQMPPQYLRNLGDRFADWPAEHLGPFFRRKVLGRGLSRLDFNGDRREDFVVSHLDTPAALVANESRNPGHHVAIRLVGRRAARDAIGTDVTVASGGIERTRQLTAGDGYLASNERLLVFGLGERDRIDRVTVRWPDGAVERHDNLPVDRTIVLVEGRPATVLPQLVLSSERSDSAP